MSLFKIKTRLTLMGILFMNSKENRLRYILGLDGLRAVAVLAVIAYHLHIELRKRRVSWRWFVFVISGYLITTILLHKQDLGYQELLPFGWAASEGCFQLPTSWFLIVSWCAIAGSNALMSIRGDALSSFFMWVTGGIFFISSLTLTASMLYLH